MNDTDASRPWWVLPSGRIRPAWWLAVAPVLIWVDYLAGAIADAALQLQRLGDLDAYAEKQVGVGTTLDVGSTGTTGSQNALREP